MKHKQIRIYGSKHIVGSSANVHLSEKYDAIVTEVPFSDNDNRASNKFIY